MARREEHRGRLWASVAEVVPNKKRPAGSVGVENDAGPVTAIFQGCQH